MPIIPIGHLDCSSCKSSKKIKLFLVFVFFYVLFADILCQSTDFYFSLRLHEFFPQISTKNLKIQKSKQNRQKNSQSYQNLKKGKNFIEFLLQFERILNGQFAEKDEQSLNFPPLFESFMFACTRGQQSDGLTLTSGLALKTEKALEVSLG